MLKPDKILPVAALILMLGCSNANSTTEAVMYEAQTEFQVLLTPMTGSVPLQITVLHSIENRYDLSYFYPTFRTLGWHKTLARLVLRYAIGIFGIYGNYRVIF